MFFTNTYLPRLGKAAKLKEFTNKHYFDLSKFYFNKDDEGINLFLDNTIKELLVNKDIYCELTCIEKLLILLDLYYNCLYDTISLHSTNIDSTISVSLKTILDHLKDVDFIEEKEILYQDIKITLNAPCSLYIKNIDNIFADLIYSITTGKEIYYYRNFSDKEKDYFLSSLPSFLFDEIIEYYNNISKKTFNILPTNDKIKLDPLFLSLTNGSIFAFLKSIYSIDLKTHYNNMLVFTKQFNGSIDSYLSLSVKDFFALYKIYENSIKQNENTLNIPSA